MQNVARYRVSGRFSDARVAELVGLTQSGLAALIRNPDYIEIESALLEGRLSKIDEELAGDDAAQKEVMRRAVPAALTTLVETVLQRRNLPAALKAAEMILNRDPDKSFADGTRTSQGNAGGGDSDAPTLPADIVASLAVEGNKVVTEIRSVSNKGRSNIISTTTTELPEAKGNA
jgi:hypothetical protein